jgi:RimJ/RimL family protein N-acetyltransferase
MALKTERLLLKEIVDDDIDIVHDLHSIPAVDEYNTLGIPESRAATEALVTGWVQQQKSQPRASYIFCISDSSTSTFIGLIALKMGKLNYRSAEVWYKLHPSFWNKGYATEALNAILKFVFHDLGLHRIEAGCAVDNCASIRVLEKVGMQREGRKREILPIRGKWVDNFFYAILQKEFDACEIESVKRNHENNL